MNSATPAGTFIQRAQGTEQPELGRTSEENEQPSGLEGRQGLTSYTVWRLWSQQEGF